MGVKADGAYICLPNQPYLVDENQESDISFPETDDAMNTSQNAWSVIKR